MSRTSHPYRLKAQFFLVTALACVVSCLALPGTYLSYLMPTTAAAAGLNISGRVTDSSNNGIADVTITVTSQQNGTTTDVRTTLTDANGNYSFTDLPLGQNSVKVEPSKFGLNFNPSSRVFVSSGSVSGDFTSDYTAKPALIVTNTNDSGTGSLRQAILDAVADDLIVFNIPPGDVGCTNGVCLISLPGGPLNINKNLRIEGPTASSVIVSGTNMHRVFNITSGNVAIVRLTITNGNGSGIFNGGILTLNMSTVSGNTDSNEGGGLSNTGSAYVVNSTISGNTAGIRGGGIFNTGSLIIRNSTITANRANSGAGGGGIFTFSTVTIGNTIVAGNKGPGDPDWDLFGGFSSEGCNLIGTNGGSASFPAGANANGDLVGTNASPLLARLGPLADNGGSTKTHALLPGSPAIDAGSNSLVNNFGLSTDQRGFDRKVDGDGNGQAVSDIGALEVRSLVVNSTADASDTNTADGVCDADAAAGAQCTLRAAIEEANARAGTDAINFNLSGAGPHVITLGNLGTLPNLSSNMRINGPGAKVLTVQRSTAGGTPDFRIFWVSSGQQVSISGLTIANGKTTGSSISNPPGKGGAIYNDHGTLSINACTLSGNSGNAWGGAIYNDGQNNDGQNANGAILTITNSTLSNNKILHGRGGAIYNDGVMGGAVLTINNSTLSGNEAGDSGGAIFNTGNLSTSTMLTINNSTITNNRANIDNVPAFPGEYGGIYTFSESPSKAVLRNTIVAGNFSGASPSTTADDIGSPRANAAFDTANSSFNLIGTCLNCALSNGTNNNQLGVTNIRLGPLADNGGPTQTHALLPGSPALDRGSNDLIPQDSADVDGDYNTTEPLPFDQRGAGHPRKADAADADTVQTVDIGAFEAHPSVEDISDKTLFEDGSGTSFGFNIGDRSLGALDAGTSLIATSSNTALLANPNVICFPTGSNCLLSLLPAPNQFGTTVITVSLTGKNGSTMSDSFTLTVNSVNDRPSFTKGADQNVSEDAGAQSVPNWATNISTGPANEAGETFSFTVTNDNNNLFSVQPSINPSGTLSYAIAPNASGTANVSVTLRDTGGTANGGQDTSIVQGFKIIVSPVNDAPTLDALSNLTINEDATLQTANLSGITAGVGESQTLIVSATSSNPSLIPNPTVNYSSPNSAGSLSFAPSANQSGSAVITVTVNDGGGTANGGVETVTRTFTVTVNAVNDAPVILIPATQSTASNSGLNFSSTGGNPINVSDVDAGSAPVQVSLASTHGTITLSGTAGLIFADGDGVSDGLMSFTGSLSNINAALDGLLFTPAQGFGGAAALTVTANDLGNTGQGDQLAATSTININVTGGASLEFSQANYVVSEGGGFINITVTRVGDRSAPASVKYLTSDPTDANFRCDPNTAGQITGQASRKCDYHIAVGRLRFAAGEESKQLTLSIVDDVFVEGPETFNLSLSNPTGTALGQNTTVPVTITDDDAAGMPNPIDNTSFFVRQLYVDLLSREPDPAGWNGWTVRINQCGQPGQLPPPCDRVTVGGDGFLRSGEFFDRQFFVLRLYRTGLGRILRYEDVGDLAYVSGFLTAEQLELNKQDLVAEIMARQEFRNRYDAMTDPLAYVTALEQTAGVQVSNEGQLISDLANGAKTRAQVFREISESAEVSNRYLHEAQVVSAYYGFFSRNPDGAYLNYLQRLDSGEITLADLANAFINAQEYRQRFGQ